VLTLLGNTEMLVYQNEGYTEPGFSALDNCEGDVTACVAVSGKVDMANPGTYVLEYSVSDSYHNTSTAQRTVRVSKYERYTDLEPVAVPQHIVPEGKVIYLTFDDGPSAHTPKLLETLEKYGVKATFFVVNTTYADYIEDIAKAGHTLAMHTYTHKFESVYSSEKAYFEDLQKIQDLIYQYSGQRPTILRFPGGSSNTISRRHCSGIMTRLTGYLDEMGYRFFDWNVDSRDAGGAKTADEVYRNVTGQIRRNELSYSVVLQHDTHAFSVRAVERIIQWGLENGYTFMTLDPTSPVCKHGLNN
jgi:peptidoglycan/xylan/chitin deacetylase (PgdA/CDA1 family)